MLSMVLTFFHRTALLIRHHCGCQHSACRKAPAWPQQSLRELLLLRGHKVLLVVGKTDGELETPLIDGKDCAYVSTTLWY
jgi:hypothetical protein